MKNANIIIGNIGNYSNYGEAEYKVGEEFSLKSIFVFHPIYRYLSYKNKNDKNFLILIYPESLLPHEELISARTYEELNSLAKNRLLEFVEGKGNSDLVELIKKSILFVMPSVGRYNKSFFFNDIYSSKAFLSLKIYNYLKDKIFNKYADATFHIDISHGHNINTLSLVDVIHNIYVAYRLQKTDVNNTTHHISYYVSDVYSPEVDFLYVRIHKYRRRVFRSLYKMNKITSENVFRVNKKYIKNKEKKEEIGRTFSQNHYFKQDPSLRNLLNIMQRINYFDNNTLIPFMLIELHRNKNLLREKDITIIDTLNKYADQYMNSRDIYVSDAKVNITYNILFNEKNTILDVMWLNSLIDRYMCVYKKSIINEDILSTEQKHFIISWDQIKKAAEILYKNENAIKEYIHTELNNYKSGIIKDEYDKLLRINEDEKNENIILLNGIKYIKLSLLKQIPTKENKKGQDTNFIVRNTIAHIGLNANFTYYAIHNEKIYFLIDTTHEEYIKVLETATS